MHRAVILLLLVSPAFGQSKSPEPSPYFKSCVITNPASYLNAKSKEVHEIYKADCYIKYIVPNKATRVVWEGRLVTPDDASHRDIMLAIDDWSMNGPANDIIVADKKGRK